MSSHRWVFVLRFQSSIEVESRHSCSKRATLSQQSILLSTRTSLLSFVTFREGILYGSPYPSKRLDIYLPSRDRMTPSSSTSPHATLNKSRTRKHSTLFAEDFDPLMDPPSGNDERYGLGDERLAPVVVFLPSAIPPITWTNKRKTYLQLALRLRRMGFCVVIPDIVSYCHDFEMALLFLHRVTDISLFSRPTFQKHVSRLPSPISDWS